MPWAETFWGVSLNKRVTLELISEKTSYSVTIASRALANNDDLSASAREFIRQTAHKLGYLHNHTACLQKQHTVAIGLIWHSIAHVLLICI